MHGNYSTRYWNVLVETLVSYQYPRDVHGLSRTEINKNGLLFKVRYKREANVSLSLILKSYFPDNDYKKFLDQLENPEVGPTATPESYLEEVEQREREKGYANSVLKSVTTF